MTILICESASPTSSYSHVTVSATELTPSRLCPLSSRILAAFILSAALSTLPLILFHRRLSVSFSSDDDLMGLQLFEHFETRLSSLPLFLKI